MKLWDVLREAFSGTHRSRVPELFVPRARQCLFFAASGYDERDHTPPGAPYYADTIIESDGGRFLLRTVAGHLLFRDVQSLEFGEASFLTLPVRSTLRPGYFSPTLFSWERRKGAWGRVLLYVAPPMRQKEHALLFLRPDGSGFALHEQHTPEFTWGEMWDVHGSGDRTDALRLPREALRPFLDTLFRSVVNPRLPDPYVFSGDLPEIKTEWRCGSEVQLRRLTHAIVCTEPELFTGAEQVQVVYRAATARRRGGALRIEAHGMSRRSARLDALCDLAFRCNAFVGERWVRLYTGNFRENRRSGYQWRAGRLHVTIAPPSHVERAEAWLTLHEWLDEALHHPGKRRRFGLPLRPEAEAQEASGHEALAGEVMP